VFQIGTNAFSLVPALRVLLQPGNALWIFDLSEPRLPPRHVFDLTTSLLTGSRVAPDDGARCQAI